MYDFAGSYYISQDDLAFGEPYKYVYLNPTETEMVFWDKGVNKANKKFSREDHQICL